MVRKSRSSVPSSRYLHEPVAVHESTMRKEYDFASMKGRKNPYARRLKKQVTLRLGVDVIEYFKALAEETGIPYQNLINLYLRECAQTGKRPDLSWAS